MTSKEKIVVKVKMDENLTDAEKQSFADVQLVKGTPGSSGYDLCVLEGGTLQAGETKVFRTGMFLEIPPGFEGQIRSRSGWALNGIVVANSPGTIDSDYRGEIGILLHNRGNIEKTIEAQSRIAQIVFCKVEIPYFHFTNVLVDTQRSDNGFGSTGL
jgi:dUTP pyrophosphatase